jgi:hypothetical protein
LLEVVTVRQEQAQEQEWLRENNLVYGPLVGVGVVARVGILVSGLAAVALYTVGCMRLERDVDPTSQEAEEPGDTE